jgi:phosphoribosyl 1,2-cyclic phosphodiesterase
VPAPAITIKFWGVRGGLPAPGAATQGFGGNSPCIEVRCDGRLLIFDAGTGIRPLGKDLIARSPVSGDVFFSSTRFNNICGLPFFAAAFHPQNMFRFWCGTAHQQGCIKDVLARLMNDPVFPVPLDIFNADLTFEDFVGGDRLDMGDGLEITTALLDGDPLGTAFRVSFRDHAICILPAAKLDTPEQHAAMVAFAKGANLMVFGPPAAGSDATEASWCAALDLADDAGVASLVLSGHAPEDDDVALDARETRLADKRPGTLLAREGQELTV